MQPLTIIFIGPQGSGKGTQIELLRERLLAQPTVLPITHIQTGVPFRELAATGGYTATVVKELVENGKLVPNVLTNAMVVNEFIRQHQQGAHVLFDGYPRDIDQAKTCEDIFTLYHRSNVHVIYLDTPEDVVTARMLERGRNDDTEAVIAERLRQYKAVTEPLITYYEQRPNTTVHRINGAATVAEVQAAIATALTLI
jgi:adenylate kinase